MKVETFKLENQGLDKKTVYYLKLSVGENSYLMNIGEKSYNTINSLNSQLTLNMKENEKGGKTK